MNALEIYTREMIKIFQQITETTNAADTDKNLNNAERVFIKLKLLRARTKLAEGIFELSKRCSKYKETCGILQSLTSRK